MLDGIFRNNPVPSLEKVIHQGSQSTNQSSACTERTNLKQE